MCDHFIGSVGEGECGICSRAWDWCVRTVGDHRDRYGRRVRRFGVDSGGDPASWVATVRTVHLFDRVRTRADLVSWSLPRCPLTPARPSMALRAWAAPVSPDGYAYDADDVCQVGIGPLVGDDFGGYPVEVGRPDPDVGREDVFAGRSVSECEVIMAYLVGESLRSDTFTVRRFMSRVHVPTMAAYVRRLGVAAGLVAWRRASGRSVPSLGVVGGALDLH